ncbi:MAG: hypothetical protein JWO38_7083 [Gemmataceae bacterium]|nr:hypothetical protein [Gemmataceae bacterium]
MKEDKPTRLKSVPDASLPGVLTGYHRRSHRSVGSAVRSPRERSLPEGRRRRNGLTRDEWATLKDLGPKRSAVDPPVLAGYGSRPE